MGEGTAADRLACDNCNEEIVIVKKKLSVKKRGKKKFSEWQKIDDSSADAEGNVTKADEINQIQEGQSVDVTFGITADEE